MKKISNWVLILTAPLWFPLGLMVISAGLVIYWNYRLLRFLAKKAMQKHGKA